MPPLLSSTRFVLTSNSAHCNLLGAAQDSHNWFLRTRDVYWTAAGQQWTCATLQPHLWRAMIEELTAAAREDYFMGFIRSKELDMQQGQGGKGRRGKGRKNHMFQIDQEALEKMRGMPQWEKLVRTTCSG